MAWIDKKTRIDYDRKPARLVEPELPAYRQAWKAPEIPAAVAADDALRAVHLWFWQQTPKKRQAILKRHAKIHGLPEPEMPAD